MISKSFFASLVTLYEPEGYMNKPTDAAALTSHDAMPSTTSIKSSRSLVIDQQNDPAGPCLSLSSSSLLISSTDLEKVLLAIACIHRIH